MPLRKKKIIELGIDEEMNRLNHQEFGETIIIKSKNLSFFVGLDDIYTYYYSYSLFFRFLRKVLRKINCKSFYYVFYGRWRGHLKKVKNVILFDNGIENVNEVAEYIKKVNPMVRVVFWYWNPAKPSDAAFNSCCIDEIWTYNRFDAKKYHLKYNPQFYRLLPIGDNGAKGSDMIFLGTDKGRSEMLAKIRKEAGHQNLSCDIRIVRSKKDSMKYEDYLSNVSKSKCIIDLVPDQFCGLTLRPLEALFLKKKLITNYEDIVNYGFYNKANIFLLGKDDINDLAKFINSPYKEIKKETVDYYSYEGWLKRIERSESVKP